MPAAMQHGRGRCVLLVVGVEDEDAVHGAREHRIDLILLAGHGKAHAQEVRRVVEIVLRVNEGLADMVLVGHGRDRRHLGDHAHRGDHALVRIGDVGGIVIEGRQRADAAAHDGHRVGVAAEAGEETAHLLVDHGVTGHTIVEIVLLAGRRQFAVKKQVADFEEVALFGELIDRIAAVKQHALVAVDIGDLGLAGGGRGEARIVGERAGLLVEGCDIDHIRPDRPAAYRQFDVLAVEVEFCGSVGHGVSLLKMTRLACVAAGALGQLSPVSYMISIALPSCEARELCVAASAFRHIPAAGGPDATKNYVKRYGMGHRCIG